MFFYEIMRSRVLFVYRQCSKYLSYFYVMLILIDVKDNTSDTASESSSLDLDFFALSTTQPSDGKSGMSSQQPARFM